MQKLTAPLAAAAVAILITLAATGMTSRAAGREAIKQTIAKMPQPAATAGLRAAVGRHNISNIVIRIDGNRQGAAPTGSIIRTTTRSGPACSTASATTKTSW